MKTYTCQCGARLHFENSLCVSCGHELGFLPDSRALTALKPVGEGFWLAMANNRRYRKCRNYDQHHVCNWMVAEADSHAYCFSCRLSEIIPDLSNPNNLKLWGLIEQAKRRLLYSLLWLELPIVNREENPQFGLAFHLMEDQGYSEFAQEIPLQDTVFTGHKSGVITLNIAEANPVAREQTRAHVNESYRTLLGHFRHESGHYYWDVLLRNSPHIEEFRALFGDERIGYGDVMQGYYVNGPVANWQTNWISGYASAHSWEDWAETWAHYLHMIDSMETANDYGFDLGNTGRHTAKSQQFNAEYLSSVSINDLVNEWSNFTVALNDMNRSMGLPDAYPFVLTDFIIKKLAFVHAIVISKGQ
ncbi:zinc-binding metallopeptidase family protein [Sedimenticola sp.]|uniref:zinc-binding metallopeptidase family protein n=1 Tax=Sedimenticola sp. TaxID=1940285 RepID=UPI00258E4591|nr:putative zinc-binding peptidase [Sedimenticola sp.]MCW8904203.1 putative zinc-binding peptidase [Sedimenticola sp.]